MQLTIEEKRWSVCPFLISLEVERERERELQRKEKWRSPTLDAEGACFSLFKSCSLIVAPFVYYYLNVLLMKHSNLF